MIVFTKITYFFRVRLCFPKNLVNFADRYKQILKELKPFSCGAYLKRLFLGQAHRVIFETFFLVP